MDITKKQLEELFLEKKLTVREASEVLGCSESVLKRLRKKFGLQGRVYSEKKIPLEKLARLRAGGWSYEAIGKKYKVSKTKIAKLCKQNGIKQEKKLIPKKELEELYLYKGMSYEEIAEEYGCCVVTVRKWRRQYRILALYPHEKKIPSPVLESYLQDGLKIAEIAKLENVRQKVIRFLIKRYKLEGLPDPDRMGKYTKRYFQMLAEDFHTAKDIAREAGCCEKFAAKELERYGIELENNNGPLFGISKETLQLYKDLGKTQHDIADLLGCARHTVYRAEKHHGIRLRKKGKKGKKKRIPKEDLLPLLEKGMTLKGIAEALKANRGTVSRELKRHGLETLGMRVLRVRSPERTRASTDISRKELAEMIAQGCTRKEMAERLDVSLKKITSAMRIHKLKYPPRSYGKITIPRETLEPFINDGVPIDRIAKILNQNRDRVRREIVDNGLYEEWLKNRYD